MGLDLPYSEDVVYIFDKQLEEAGLLVMNKVDLLSVPDQEKMAKWADSREYNSGPWRFQNSLSTESVAVWVDILQEGEAALPQKSLDIDYERYGRGETHMAWLNETLSLLVPEGEGRQIVETIIESLLEKLDQEQAAIGHLKFVISGGDVSTKISFTGLEEMGWEGQIPAQPGTDIQMLVNMRAETEAGRLHQLLHGALASCQDRFDFQFIESNVEFFHPAEPKPTHRLS